MDARVSAGFEVRWLGPDDEALAARALRDVVGDDLAPGWLGGAGLHFAVVTVEGVPAGVAFGHTLPLPDGRTELLLYSLDVAEPYRRTGIGRALALAFRERARALGFDEAWVLTDTDNEAGNATYRSAGGEAAPPATMYTWTVGRPGG